MIFCRPVASLTPSPLAGRTKDRRPRVGLQLFVRWLKPPSAVPELPPRRPPPVGRADVGAPAVGPRASPAAREAAAERRQLWGPARRPAPVRLVMVMALVPERGPGWARRGSAADRR